MNYWLKLGAIALLAGSCESSPSTRPPHPPKPAPIPAPIVQASTKATLEIPDDSIWRIPPHMQPTQWGYHRYRGTLGGQPVQLELTVMKRPFGTTQEYVVCEGSYYYPRLGIRYQLSTEGSFEPLQPLELRVECNAGDLWSGDIWCANQPLGPQLSGTFLERGSHRAVPFDLHESYAEGAHYEMLTEELRDRVGQTYGGNLDTSYVHVEYLHLLGRDTLRLARLQCPTPARRLRARRALSAERTTTTDDLACVYEQRLEVTLNECELLTYHESLVESVVGMRHGSHSGHYPLYDLRAGRQLNLLAQLRLGGLLAVRRLLARQAQRDTVAADTTQKYWVRNYAQEYWIKNQLMKLPEQGFAITPAGWEATYNTTPEDDPYIEFIGHISWAELRPWLRPQSPLNRILAARGLGPAK